MAGDLGAVTLSGVLPGGPRFAAIVSSAVIVLAIDGRVCTTHPRWMTRAEAAELGEALQELTRAVPERSQGMSDR